MMIKEKFGYLRYTRERGMRMKKKAGMILTLAMAATMGLSVTATAAEENAILQNTKVRFNDGTVQTVQCYNVSGFNFIRARDVSNYLDIGIRPAEKGVVLDTKDGASGNETERLTKQKAIVHVEKGHIDFDGTKSETECFLLDGRYYFKLADFQKASEAHLQEDENAQYMTVAWDQVNRIVDVRLEGENSLDEIKEEPLVDTQNTDAYEKEVVRLVNIEREKANVAPLEMNEGLQNATDIRAKELNTLFSHDRPDGTTCFTVLKEVGVLGSAMGENIAQGQRTPEEVVNAWMNSPGHRSNILNSNFTQIGVGYDSTANSWVQLFIG